MKIKVVYRKTVEEEIEVDDKYYALTEKGGYNDLPNEEVDKLINGIIIDVEHNTEADYDDIYYIETTDDGIIFEG